jgi:hypothetical protein
MLLGVETDDERGDVDNLLADTYHLISTQCSKFPKLRRRALTGCVAGG